MSADKRIEAITARIAERSRPLREPYLDRVRAAATKGVHRSVLS
jgi:phosphogluconate dehydratase